MKTQQLRLVDGQWDPLVDPSLRQHDSLLALVMGDMAGNLTAIRELAGLLPKAHIAGVSTSGEILNQCLEDQGLSVTLLAFDHSRIRTTSRSITDPKASYLLGKGIAQELDEEDLQLILVLSDGLKVYGSDLAHGLADNSRPGVAITGGLAGDNSAFIQTWTLLDDSLSDQQVVAVGLYGDHLHITQGSRGGWTPFGPERQVTDSQGHELFELDHQAALTVYKEYLGDKVDGLPFSGLRYPLEISQPGSTTRLVRTMLAVDEQRQSITFAGGIPKGSVARLMRASVESIIQGANDAIHVCLEQLPVPQFTLMVSCVGRKQVLKQMADEELEVVREALPETTMVCGFYSYGEISPADTGMKAELHNQTMTITCLSET
ncbi:FIST signal transduction protein [Shewanella sp. GXUN23E]|uniref:FIST signal transduction protein n=1 Tax=Shewanella sp. GXUN23E TaxID=3422498 RepID=UPI003D7E96D6